MVIIVNKSINNTIIQTKKADDILKEDEILIEKQFNCTKGKLTCFQIIMMERRLVICQVNFKIKLEII